MLVESPNISEIIIFGPGETKRKFANSLTDNKVFAKDKVKLVDGIDISGEDGIYVFLRSLTMKDVLKSSKISQVVTILEEILRSINKSERRYAIGFKEIAYATEINAVDSLIFSDNIFNHIDEEKVMLLLNRLEENNSKIFAVDSSTDIGLRVSALGGIVAYLRYNIH
jgi:protein pelota